MNTTPPQRFGENDIEGKIFFSHYLESKGYDHISIPDAVFCPYDIEAYRNGQRYIFELKNRTVTSTQYGDSIIDSGKYSKLSQLDAKVYIVNFFTDCFHVHKLDSYDERQNHMCQKTNNWDRTKVPRILISYKNKQSTKYEYT